MKTIEILFWAGVALGILGAGMWLGWVRARALTPEAPEPWEAGPVRLVRNRAPLSAEDLARVLQGWDVTDERWQAIEDVFDACFAEMLADVTRRGAMIGERDYAAGALEGLRYFDARLRGLQAQPARRGADGPE